MGLAGHRSDLVADLLEHLALRQYGIVLPLLVQPLLVHLGWRAVQRQPLLHYQVQLLTLSSHHPPLKHLKLLLVFAIDVGLHCYLEKLIGYRGLS